MRYLNLIIIVGIGAFALLLLGIAAPTFGERPLAHWALNVGAYSTVLTTSLFYLLIQFRIPAERHNLCVLILVTYIPVVILSAISGGFWGVVGHVMETERTSFYYGLSPAVPSLVLFYSMTLMITLFTFMYTRRKLSSPA